MWRCQQSHSRSSLQFPLLYLKHGGGLFPVFLAYCRSGEIVSFHPVSWSIFFAFPFLRRVVFERTFSAFRARASWHPRSTIFAFFFSSIRSVCCCSVSWSLSLRNQHVLPLLLDDVIIHSPQSMVASRFLFQNRLFHCRSCKFSKTCHTNYSQKLILFLLKPDWTSWGCRCTTRHWANHSKFIVCPDLSLLMSKNKNLWNILCLPESTGLLFLSWVSSKKLICVLNSAGIIVIFLWQSFDPEFQMQSGACRIWIVQSPFLHIHTTCQVHFCKTIRWPIEDELVPMSLLCGKRLSKNWILTLAAKVQIRISLFLSFVRSFHRQPIACPTKQCKSMEYDSTSCLLRVAMSVMENQLFLLAGRVVDYLFPMVVDEKMSNARSFLLLSSSCFAPPPPW